MPQPGVLTRRAPDARESADIVYGLEIARQIAGLDLDSRWSCAISRGAHRSNEEAPIEAMSAPGASPRVGRWWLSKVAKPSAGHAF